MAFFQITETSPLEQISSLALFGHPPSAEFLLDLEGSIDADVPYMTLAGLRQRPLSSIPGYLRSLRINTLYLPAENASARALLPIMAILGLLSGIPKTSVCELGKKPRPLSRLKAITMSVSVLAVSLTGQLAMLYCHVELALLKHKPRITASIDWAEGKGIVLYVLGGLWTGSRTGGAIAHIAGVVNALLHAGNPVRYLCTGRPVMISETVEIVEVKPLEIFAMPSEINLYRHHLSFASQARDLAGSGPIKWIYARMSLGNYGSVKLSRALGVPLIIEYNGSEVWIARHWGNPLRYESLAKAAEGACLSHAHLIVTVSEQLRDELLERGVPPERIIFHPNGVDTEVFNPDRFSKRDISEIRLTLGFDPEDIIAGFVGTFGRWHGAEILAEAFAKLWREESKWMKDRKLKLLMVGDGLMRNKSEQILDSAGCLDHACFTGLIAQQNAPLYMAACDILVSPHAPNEDGSPFFGSPTKLFEYMASAKPIIASDLGQIGDILAKSPKITDPGTTCSDLNGDDAAILVHPGNVSELTSALRIASDNPAWRVKAGTKARHIVQSHYSWDSHVEAILDGLIKSGV